MHHIVCSLLFFDNMFQIHISAYHYLLSDVRYFYMNYAF